MVTGSRKQRFHTRIGYGPVEQMGLVIVHKERKTVRHQMRPLLAQRPFDQHPRAQPDKTFNLGNGQQRPAQLPQHMVGCRGQVGLGIDQGSIQVENEMCVTGHAKQKGLESSRPLDISSVGEERLRRQTTSHSRKSGSHSG